MFTVLVAVGLLALAGLIGCAGRDSVDRTTVAALDPASLMGRWYEIARFDHRFERGLSQVEALYVPESATRFRVENSGYDARKGERRTTVGKAKTTGRPGRFRVAFFWNFYADYNILERSESEGWMLVGSRSPHYLWILSRTPTLPPSVVDRILWLARQRGYDTSELLFQ